MKYIAIIHKSEDSCYGVTLPDFPGCFSGADNFEDIPAMVQEAVEVWADGEDVQIPVPSTFEQVRALEESQDGMLMLVDINFDFLGSKTVPVNVTMPLYMKRFIDFRAKNAGMTRSGFLQAAAAAYRPEMRP